VKSDFKVVIRVLSMCFSNSGRRRGV